MTSTLMTKKQVAEVLLQIHNVYPRFDVTQSRIDTWHGFLKDQNPATVMMKVERHIATEKFPPTIAEITEIKPKKSITQIQHEKMLAEHRAALERERSQ